MINMTMAAVEIGGAQARDHSRRGCGITAHRPHSRLISRLLTLACLLSIVFGLHVAVYADPPSIEATPSAPDASLPSNHGDSAVTPPKFILTAEEATRQWEQILAHGSAPPKGFRNAPFSMVLFGDLQCPQCGKVYPMLNAAVAHSRGSLNLYYVDRPFPTTHKYAIPAAMVSREAAAEGLFWPMCEYLLTHQDELDSGNYITCAKAIGADPAKIAAAAVDKRL